MIFYTNILRQRGVSLIEALITAVLLAVGLLSVAALQARSLQASHLSYQRSVAVSQANDAIERLWAGICYLVDDGDLQDKLEEIKEDWEAVHDNTTGMVGWEGNIDIDTSNRLVTVTITWDDSRVESSAFIYNTTVLPNPELLNCGFSPPSP